MHRVLLLIPHTSYRAEDFLEAADRLGVEVVVGSNHRQTLAPLVPGATLHLDFHDVEGAARAIVEFAGARPLSAVVATDDEGVEVAAAAADALALPHNPVEAVRAARHKDAMRQALADAGVPVPAFRVFSVDGRPDALARRVSYPCVLKPVFLSASRGVIRADNPEEFTAAFRRISAILDDWDLARHGGETTRRILVEDYVPGLEVAVEGMLVDGHFHVLAVLDKPDPLDGPYFEETIYVAPSRLPAPVRQEIIDAAGRAARALGLREGPVHAEVRHNRRGPWVIEVAPRSIGGLCSRILRFGTGLSLEEVILHHALGTPPTPLARTGPAAGVMMIPIPRGGVLEEVRGLDRARRVRGVEDVTLTIPRGHAVVPLPEGNQYLGFIFARAETPEEVEIALREAHRRLEVVISAAPPRC